MLWLLSLRGTEKQNCFFRNGVKNYTDNTISVERCFFTNKLLQKESDTNPKLYLRYVNDIFAIFEDQRFSTTFLDLLNSQHNSIRFTMEKSNGTISFLDVEIQINPNGFDTWTWRKPTHTGLFLNFCAVCLKAWKESLVFCLLHGAKEVCSSVNFFKTEVD